MTSLGWVGDGITVALAGSVGGVLLSGLEPNRLDVPDTKETREKKGRVKEQQLLEADIETAAEVAGTPPESPLDDDDEAEIDLSFEE